MARKRKDDQAEPTGTSPGENGEAPVATETTPENGNGKRHPLVSYGCNSDATTRISVAVWGKEMESDGRKWTQYQITTERSWRDRDGNWHNSGKDDEGNVRMFSHRAHDLLVLIFLLQKAHAWCLEQRTSNSDIPF